MKIKDLIKELEKFNLDLEVVVSDPEFGYFEVSQPKLIKNITVGGIFNENKEVLKKAVVL